MGRPLKIQKVNNSIPTDVAYPPFSALTDPVYPVTMASTEYYGVVGGDDAIATATYPTVKIRVKIAANAEADGYIIRQKGSIKYLVTDGTNTGVCQLADLADGTLTDNTMTITYDTGDSAVTRISKLTNKWALDYTGGASYSAAAVVQRIRYLANFFDAGSTAIKSGTAGQTVTLAEVENWT